VIITTREKKKPCVGLGTVKPIYKVKFELVLEK